MIVATFAYVVDGLGAAGGCIVSVRWFSFFRHGVTFICVWTIRTSKTYTIKDKKANQWSVCYRTRVKGILVIIVISNV